MATKHTTNYKLCQWAASDKVDHLDFNADNLAIDTAIKGAYDAAAAARSAASTAQSAANAAQTAANAAYSAANPSCAVGYYEGSGATTRIINLGFTPRAVWLTDYHGRTYSSGTETAYYGGLAVTGRNASFNPAGQTKWVNGDTSLAIVSGGFQVGYASSISEHVQTNKSGITFYYVAFR